ncbi:MAG TPA: hypothetical protein VI685_04570 [Candidatus Angelobacter sp.]
MAALTAILSALGKVVRRELRSLLSVTLNNFFLVAAFLAYGSLASGRPPLASAPFFFLMALFLLFPASGDPLDKIPQTTLALWPLTRRQRAALRVATFALSPVVLAGLVILITVRSWAALILVAAMIGIRAVAFVGLRARKRWPRLYPRRLMPTLPTAIGRLFSLNLRQLFCLLDFYLAIVVSILGCCYRFLSRHPEPAAFPILAILVGLASSTWSQSLFGMESRGSLMLYRLLPLRGWQVLLAKDAAYVAIVCVLTLPLDPPAGIIFALAALAIGRYPSLTQWTEQRRWRFAGGDIRFGFAQIFIASGIAFSAAHGDQWFIGTAFLAYVASLVIGGWYWDRSSF